MKGPFRRTSGYGCCCTCIASKSLLATYSLFVNGNSMLQFKMEIANFMFNNIYIYSDVSCILEDNLLHS